VNLCLLKAAALLMAPRSSLQPVAEKPSGNRREGESTDQQQEVMQGA
jgi:hypothetical protein